MKIDRSLIAGSTTLLVLSLLKDGEKYGYQMISELDRRSENVFSLREGTLYPLLHTLEKEGLIISSLKVAESGRERKYYSLTKKGAVRLSEKAQEWRTFSRAVDSVVRGLT